jgi:anti-sigma regulatory factor (Ser/Thr protein kinase)
MASDRLVLHLDHVAASPSVARAAVRDYSEEHGLARPDREAALLVASELVSNAVRHGAAPITLCLERLDDGALRVEVCDAGDGIEPLQVDSGDWATTGRGLAIVAALARDWRVERRANGKSVSAEIART